MIKQLLSLVTPAVSLSALPLGSPDNFKQDGNTY